jgi:putative superfamily III holin-X
MPQDPLLSNHEATPQDASISELVQQLSEQTSRLARQEVELAKAEMTIKGKRLGIGAGAFGGAGLVGLFGLGALTAAVILLLATAMDAWVAALIVAVVYLAVAGALALIGKSKVESATPPVPERAVASVKQDVEQTKLRAKEGRA